MKVRIDVLITAATGIYVSEEGLHPVSQLAAFMTGAKEFWLHDLVRLDVAMEAPLQKEFPWIKQINLKGLTEQNLRPSIDLWAEKYGMWHEVTSKISGFSEMHPSTSAAMINPNMKVFGQDEDGNLIDFDSDVPED